MSSPAPGRGFLRLLSTAVIDQAVLSGANFLVGVMLLRLTSDADYGLFVMATSALLLVNGVQGALVTGPMSVMAPKKTPEQRRDMIGALFEQVIRIGVPLAVLAALGFVAAQWLGWVQPAVAHVAAVAAGAAAITICREFLRQVLLINSRPGVLLAIDIVYVSVMLSLVAAASLLFSPAAAPYAVGSLGCAALVAGLLSFRGVDRHVGWRFRRYPGALRETWRLGRWGIIGCVITWAHTQGFYYVLAGLLSVEAVAGVAAARLLLMPVNLLVTGVGQQLLPVAAAWAHEHGMKVLVRRATMIGLALFGAAALYFGLLWLLRHWIVADILKREVAELDPLLLLWGAVYGIVTLRSATMIVLQALERFDVLVYLAFVSTTVSLLAGWWGIVHYGVPGAVIGIVIGELIDLAGNIAIITRALRRPAPGA